MNKIDSRIDWLLNSCYRNCFVCRKPFEEPPKVDKHGRLEGRCMWFSIVVDEYGTKEDTEERICDGCWVSDLSQFATSD